MGSLSNPRRRGESALQFLRRTSDYHVGATWPGAYPGQEYKVVALKAGRGGAYGVLQLTDEQADTVTCRALIIKMETRHGETRWTAMTEADGPVLDHMPESLLRRLTPVDKLPGDAMELHRCHEWRARCLKQINKRKALAQPGVRFSVTGGINFKAGVITEFAVENLTSRIFVANPGTPDSFRCRLTQDCFDRIDVAVHP
jgi:hypothetical protein